MYLCIDQGGQTSRAVVYSAAGEILAESARPIETIRRPGLKVEHDAGQMLQSVLETIAEVLGSDNVRPERITAAGLATQRSTLVCLDRMTGEPLSSVISWQDRRAADWLNQFADHGERIKARTGLRLSPHYGVSKIAWCLENVPQVNEAADKSRLVAAPLVSFLLQRILEERPWLVDPCNASRTLLMDSLKLCWDPELLDLFGIPPAVLPTIVPTGYPFGHLKVGATRIPLTVASGDQAAAIFAWGDPAPGTAFVNMGTGAFIQTITGAAPIVDQQLLSSVVYSRGDRCLYVLEGTVNGAASAVNLVRKDLGLSEQELLAKGQQWLMEIDTDLLYLNGVGGLGSPDWIADFPSHFVGDGQRADKIVATYESIVFLIVRNLGRMGQRLNISAIVASGGVSQLDGLCQRLANLSGLVVSRPGDPEATAAGVAYLLGMENRTGQGNQRVKRFTPNADGRLAARYQRWSELLDMSVAVARANV